LTVAVNIVSHFSQSLSNCPGSAVQLNTVISLADVGDCRVDYSALRLSTRNGTRPSTVLPYAKPSCVLLVQLWLRDIDGDEFQIAAGGLEQ
jgi:hypothetical protein